MLGVNSQHSTPKNVEAAAVPPAASKILKIWLPNFCGVLVEPDTHHLQPFGSAFLC